MLAKTSKAQFSHARSDRVGHINEVALRLIDEPMRAGCNLPEFMAALAVVVGSVAAQMRAEARAEFYRRFLAAADSAETEAERALETWRARH